MRHLAIGIGAVWVLACGSSGSGSGSSGAGGASAGAGLAAVGGSGGAGRAGSAAGSGGAAAGSGGAGQAAVGGSGGASAGRSGSGGAGSSGASGGPAAGSCSGVFCEDFEAGQLNTAVWSKTQLSSGNTVTVQDKQVAHGRYAAQFHARGGITANDARYSVILHDGLPTALQKHYFGRLYFYATDFPSENGGHTAYIFSSNGLSQFPDSDRHLEVGSYHESSQVVWQMTFWGGPEYLDTGGKIPQAKWFCLEWEFNDAPDEIAIWVDGDAKQGAAFRNINNGASGLVGKLTSLGLGFRTWHPAGAPDIDVYIDDVVLDTKRVGCL